MQIKDKNTDKALVWKADAVFQTNKYFGNDRVDACVADLDSFLADKLAGLQEEAQALADEFWEVHIKTNKTKELKEKSKLCVRVGKKTKIVGFEWGTNFWIIKPGQKRKNYTTYLTKGRDTDGYKISTLLKHAKPWEEEMVIETERKATLLRRESKRIVLMMTHLKRFIETGLDSQNCRLNPNS